MYNNCLRLAWNYQAEIDRYRSRDYEVVSVGHPVKHFFKVQLVEYKQYNRPPKYI